MSKANAIVESLVVEPLLTPAVDDVIVMVGLVPSNVQVNCVAAIFPLLAPSVNTPAATLIVQAPSAVGVKVAVYTVALVEANRLMYHY